MIYSDLQKRLKYYFRLNHRNNSNNRLSQIRAMCRSKSKFISAGSQISAGLVGKRVFQDTFHQKYILLIRYENLDLNIKPFASHCSRK